MKSIVGFLKSSYPAFILLGIIIIAFYNIAFYYHPMKFDALDCTLPWRYFISTCFSDGVFPFWNPYQHLGYPFYGDAQSTLYYPITLLLSVWPGYSLKVLHIDFLFHVWMGAVGMFVLAKGLKMNNSVAYILAISYVLSGFFIGNAQHFYWIVSAAWLPFVIHYYLKTIDNLSFRDALILAFFLFMMISGGYPAFVIVLAYIFALVFLIILIDKFIKKKNSEAKRFILLNVFVFIMVLGLSFVQIISVLDNYDFSSRAEGLLLSQVLFSPFSFQSLSSFVLPLMSVKGFTAFGTDMSMANGYFGIFTFVFFILFLFQKKTAKHRFILFISLFCLIIALGEKFYLREILFNYIPLFDTFRFPSAFRLFVILGFILFAGFYLKNLFESDDKRKLIRQMFITLLAVVAFFVFVLFDTFHARPENIFAFVKQHVLKGDFLVNIETLAFVQAFWNLILILFFALSFILFKAVKTRFLIIVLFVLLDLGVASRLNSSYTVYSSDLSFEELNDFEEKNFVKKYPIPSMEVDVIHHSDTSSLRRPGLWRNLNNYYGQFAYDGFSSYINKNIDLMEDSLLNVYRCVLRNKPVYLSECVLPYEQLNPEMEKHICDYANVSVSGAGNNDSVSLLYFSPNRIEISATTDSSCLLCLLQSHHKYWELEVNGKASELIFVNNLHMGAVTEKGKNLIVFKFRPKYFLVPLIISLFSWLIFMVLFVFYWLRKKSK